MKFSYEWLQSYFDSGLPKPKKLADVLTMHSFETENDGDILDIDIMPNRVSDCASHMGIAREISIILNLELKIQSSEFKKESFKTEDYVSIEVEDKDLCPRYMALVIKNIEVKDSPEWMQKRLKAIGQKSINNIVDTANYVMLETGQPLHAFDLEKIEGKKIVVRKAQDGEKIDTLDNQKINLTKEMLVIADNKEPLAIAGIKGGKKAEITNNTKDIVVEAAVFDGPNIRQTSKALNLRTDASMRFEHGLSLFLPEIGMNRVAQLIQELAGGEMANSSLDVCDRKPALSEIDITEEEVEKKLGQKIKNEEIKKILSNLSLAERTDIKIKEDLIEEVARFHGYENIVSQLPDEIKIPPEKNEEYLYCNWIRGILAGEGFTEVYNYSIGKIGDLRLRNPISSDKIYLRMNLSEGLKSNISENLKNFDTVKLFEIGKTFYNDKEEILRVAVAIGYKKGKRDIKAELRGVADALLIKDAENYIEDNVFEIDLGLIIEAAKDNGVEMKEFESGDFKYEPFSKYPVVTRDISIFVPNNTQVVEVMDVIENTAGELLIDTDLFDIFLPRRSEAEAGEPQKSFAFRLIFQSFEKTLTDNEVNDIRDKIIKALEENIKWEVRKK